MYDTTIILYENESLIKTAYKSILTGGYYGID